MVASRRAARPAALLARLDPATQRWTDTGVLIDARRGAKLDALCDGDRLYLASHLQQPDPQGMSGRSAAATSVELRRYRYDPIAQSYLLELGPVAVAPGDMEAFVLAHDTTGVLWGAFTQDNVVKVVHTQGSDADWSAPVPLPVPGTAVSSDDTAALVAFGGKIGVLWSNQCPRYAGCPNGVVDQTFHFAWHADGDPDDAWTGETAYAPGGHAANDHVNLKADASGRVYVAVKTSFTQPAEPLVVLLVREPDGAWRASPVGTVADDQTRPVVVVDEERGEVSVFATAPLSGGAIYGKRASLTDLVFAPGRGTPVIESAADARITNVTSTKQPVDERSGIVLLAADDTTHRYLHATLALPPPVGPEPVAPADAAPGGAAAADGNVAANRLVACRDGPLYPVGAAVVTTRPTPAFDANAVSVTGATRDEAAPRRHALLPGGLPLVIAGPYLEAGDCDLWPVQRPDDGRVLLVDESALRAAPSVVQPDGRRWMARAIVTAPRPIRSSGTGPRPERLGFDNALVDNLASRKFNNLLIDNLANHLDNQTTSTTLRRSIGGSSAMDPNRGHAVVRGGKLAQFTRSAWWADWPLARRVPQVERQQDNERRRPRSARLRQHDPLRSEPGMGAPGCPHRLFPTGRRSIGSIPRSRDLHMDEAARPERPARSWRPVQLAR